MNIFITNDDGIESTGLKCLVKAFSKLGDVYVVAPNGERSSNSHHLTCFGKVKIEERQVEGAKNAYALWGTPADCTYLGLDFLYKDKIDLVVSGINRGLNVSTDNSKISTTMTNNSFEIKDSGDNVLAFFGYDETENISKSQMDNLTVTNYFVSGYHRTEKFERNGERRTGHFYIG